ncbi:DNA methyltransferase [uncultured Amaricoccus sp.]|uniref:class I SAM-dependent DNA methyltransferase n=1 Tax=uncultured Amaricoccus sp. TaxID=339341 RepID=UPI00260A1A52|nr:DNA methyltransferase [uncultured Amaricoccus sp.]
MTPLEFIAKWRPVALKERSTAQTHFNDLCRLLGLDDPVAADPTGEWFTFEKGATRTGGGEGWADVWRKECFGWEYKGRHKDLEAAYRQLLTYAVALENPPLLVTCDTDRIVIRTNFTNTVQETHTLALDDLLDGAKRDLLRAVFTEPDRLRPKRTRDALTAEAASKFSLLALRLRERGHAAATVAHFVNRLVFCMFAEDVGLLPERLFQKMLEASRPAPAEFAGHAALLFAAMKDGGRVGFTAVDWFNGGLFDDATALPLEKSDVDDLLEAARLDWSQIDPSILGTLFERGLDPGKRSQLGAHYTDRDKIMKIVDPVIVRPLLAEWAEVRDRIEALLAAAPQATAERLLRGADLAARTRAVNAAEALHRGFLDRLKAFRVLDPACGSGNFLYLALRALKDIEHRANLEAEALGLPRGFPEVGPEAVRGIELNPYAAELARVSVWIGEIQWMRANGFEASRNPILRPLETIECRDAILNEDGTRAEWPDADVVVGNPPFLGGGRHIRELGVTYTSALRQAFRGIVPESADLVTYWLAQSLSTEEGTTRVGFVTTNSVRSSFSNVVLVKFIACFDLYAAWSDEAWVVEGAAVRVSLICGSREPVDSRELDGMPVASISPRLNTGGSTPAKIHNQDRYIFRGPPKIGPFDVSGQTARQWLNEPLNPNGRLNSDVLRPIWIANDIVRRPADKWIVDFDNMNRRTAALYEKPFSHVREFVYPLRLQNQRAWRRDNWWLHGETVPALRSAMSSIHRVIVTPMVSKFRVFVWMPVSVLPDQRLMIIARDDDASLGILESKIHYLWSVEYCSWHGAGNDPVYNAGSVFSTFPFPEGLTPDIPAADYAGDPRAQAIAAAAAELNAKREAWLNPDDLVVRVPEVVAGYPDRVLPKDEAAAVVLKKRTLTNLYNARPAWLDHAHARLDQAVADAYGWGDDWRAGRMGEDEILARLFALNQSRTAAAAR